MPDSAAYLPQPREPENKPQSIYAFNSKVCFLGFCWPFFSICKRFVSPESFGFGVTCPTLAGESVQAALGGALRTLPKDLRTPEPTTRPTVLGSGTSDSRFAVD